MAIQHFGKYLFLDKIGSGGMAEVFLAKQRGIKGFEKVLAIKRILPNLTENPEFVTMFINEAKLAALLSHQNIVQIYELGHYENVYYIAMEYLMGKDLRTVFNQARTIGFPPSVGQVLLIFTKICSGLDYAHRKKDLNGHPLNIVHRDISPQNVLVSYEGEIKIVDFGIAKAASQTSETRAGMIKGKLAYLAPEQAWGKAVDCRSDIFAMGIVLYEMLTGQKLFTGQNEFSVLEKVREGKVDPVPSKLNPKVSPELEAILLKALAKDPKDRFQSAVDFQIALEDHMSQKGYDFSNVRLTQYLQGLFSVQMQQDSQRFRAAEQAAATTPTEDKMTVVRPTRRPATPATAAKGTRNPSHSTGRRIFRAVRRTTLTLILLFVSVVWMAQVDFPLIYSLRVRSPSAQAIVDDLARLPDTVFERWIVPQLPGLIDSPGEPQIASVLANAAVSSPESSLLPSPILAKTVDPGPRPLTPRERDEIQRLLAQVELDYDKGKLKEVEEKLRRIIDIDPSFPKPYILLGNVLIEQDESTKALRIIQEATKQFPENSRLHYDLGFLYLKFDLALLAKNELERGLELNPIGPASEKAINALEDLSKAPVSVKTNQPISIDLTRPLESVKEEKLP